MGILFGSKKKDELMLVFDIGSSAVSGALFWAQKSGIPKIIFSVKEPIPVLEKIDLNQFLVKTIQSLETAARKIHLAKLGAPKRIFCVLSSPWYVSEARIISFKKNTPFVFSAKLADDLMQQEIKLFEEENSKKYAGVGDNIRIVELKSIKTILNGYEISEPLNQKTEDLEMSIFVSISGEKILRKIENAIEKHFRSKYIKFSSFAVASFTTVRDLHAHQENFILVDIGGETTDIFMIKKNALQGSVSFPLGRNLLIRKVASDLNCSLDEASSLISLYKDGHAEKSLAKKLSLSIGESKTEWLKKFQESLANLSNDISIPSAVYITADKNLVGLFSAAIKNEQFSQYAFAESKFEIIPLNTDLLYGIAAFHGPAVREPAVIIDSVYINRFLIEK